MPSAFLVSLSELKSITCLRKIVCMYRSKIGVTVFFVSRLGFLNFHDSGNANLSNSSNCPYQSGTYANSNKSGAIILFSRVSHHPTDSLYKCFIQRTTMSNKPQKIKVSLKADKWFQYSHEL